MIKVVGLRVRSLDVDFFELSWRIEDTTVDVLDFTFQVLRSESPAGPWDEICDPFSDRYVYFDRAVPAHHANRDLFYILRVRNKLDGKTEDFGPISRQPEADLIAQEIRRHLNILYREHSGRRCWLLPVRTFGQRCTCWNKTLQKRTRSGCPLCFDTGFVRGYLSPIEVWADISPEAKSETTITTGNTIQKNARGKVVATVPVKPRDILIEAENRRWRVVNMDQTEKNRAGILIEFSLHEIPSSDIEYAIELKMDQALKDVWLAPARNFTNPHNLSNFENEEIPSIFSLYPTTYPRK